MNQSTEVAGLVEACQAVASHYDESYSPMCLERRLGDKCRAALEKLTLTEAPEPLVERVWHKGCPPMHIAAEWFIAKTTYSDRVVLTALPEEYSYDYKTADETYIKADKIKAWMQFPDSEFIPYAPEASAVLSDERVKCAAKAIHEHLSRRDIMAYLDNEEDCEGIALAALSSITTTEAESGGVCTSCGGNGYTGGVLPPQELLGENDYACEICLGNGKVAAALTTTEDSGEVEYLTITLTRDGVVTAHHAFDADFDEMVQGTQTIVTALQERLVGRAHCPFSRIDLEADSGEVAQAHRDIDSIIRQISSLVESNDDGLISVNRQRLYWWQGVLSDLRDHRIASQPSVEKKPIPRDIAEQVVAMGQVEWGATAELVAADHAADFVETLRLTRENFNYEDVPVRLHGLYLKGTETVLCHTGTSPNSGANAQALAGAWNWLHEQSVTALATPDMEAGK